ncbi:MAG: ribonuclease domain-containing protein [Bacteroidota bacterium]
MRPSTIKNIINYRKLFYYLFIFSLFSNCKSNQENNRKETNKNTETVKKSPQPENNFNPRNQLIPEKSYEIRDYVRKNGKAKFGYIGGREFKNLEKLLPQKTLNGQKIIYQEWDIHKKITHKNRGKDRLVTGSDGKDYFTNDHYRSFLLLLINSN